ncbi:ferredoxin [Caldilinea sp.]|uniref:(2Fe-2S) ferredoxin domain-containing protein n=1 Tax=Caldilinea sp. TaxID=2293560 RepID=UPI002C5E86D9|nr:(2Fe-2S) ferredoxin domain-containing protein [Anaerolineales bacterium]HQY90902.1 ferredoxin [Caldilinea sp.]HRA68953.1 ferredoxin [Caldilinea sp.]
MSQFKKHVFICTQGPYCGFDGDTETIFERMKRQVGAYGLNEEIRVNRAGCLNQCGHGPILVVYPEAVWYSNVQAEDVDEIVATHLIGDRIVERLIFDAPPGNNKRVDHYPAAVHAFKDATEKLQKEREALRQATLRTLQQNAES